MNEQTIWNVNYNANRIEAAVDIAEPLVAKLIAPINEPLTPEETWQLREAIRSIGSHNRMTRDDMREATADQIPNRIKRLFHRK
jgi:hypothetical protein